METSSNKTSKSSLLNYSTSPSTNKKILEIIINRSAFSSSSSSGELNSTSNNTTQNQTYYNNLNIENMEFFLLKDNKSDKTQKDDVSSVSSKSDFEIADNSLLSENKITHTSPVNHFNARPPMRRSQSI